jgi:CDP-diacylglycerol--serine O-phosphatidyltransferase
VNLRKTFFILPNLFTLSSVFCGFFAIATTALGKPQLGQFHQAALAILFGLFFDLADGRVARLTKTQSALGRELDSLADVITFGVAPALLMYRWGLDRIEPLAGIAVAFVFLAAAALRLARFNVLSIKEAEEGKTKPGKFIVGLPVPAAACVLVSFVVLSYQLQGTFIDISQAALALVVVVLSYLMVSRVRFRSFKDVRLSRRTVTAVGGIVAAVLVAIFWKRVPSALVLVTLTGAYVALGLFEEVIFYRRRRLEDLAAKTTPIGPIEADGGARSDEEVLEELGAYDENDGEAPDAPGPAPALKTGTRR